MSLLYVVIVLVIVGLVLYAINQYIPMDPKIKTILNIVVIIFVVVWLLRVTGVWAYLSSAHLSLKPPTLKCYDCIAEKNKMWDTGTYCLITKKQSQAIEIETRVICKVNQAHSKY